MKIIWNVLLVLGAAASAAALMLQGFALPALSAGLSLALRITAAVCVQWLFLRIMPKKAIQAIPMLITAIFAVWGFFLYLTSPSWLGATFRGFLADYAAPALSCGLVWAFSWLIPRIVPRVRKALRMKNRQKKKKSK